MADSHEATFLKCPAKTSTSATEAISVSTLSSAPSETDNLSRSYENPNYRKLYAKLSMDAMIGKPGDPNDESSKGGKEDSSEVRPDGPIPTEEETDEPEDLQFFYDDYEEDEDDEEEAEEDEYYEDDLEYSPTATNGTTFPANSNPSKDVSAELPDGWERHDDALGNYFWHIPTGTIQREKPFLDTIDKSMIRSDSLVFLDKSAINVDYNPADLIEEEEEEPKGGAVDEDADEDVEKKVLISKKKVIANLRLTFPTDDEEEPTDTEDEDPERLSFIVHSLGWLDVDESQINQQTGAMVIRRCIQQLSRNAESVRCWGPSDTQSLILRLGGEKICLLDPTTETVLSIQLIREIRMWAVDEQNYFAYVVKDRSTSNALARSPKTAGGAVLKCHVFHCDDTAAPTGNTASAQLIALYLKDALIRIKNKTVRNGAHVARPNKLNFNHVRNRNQILHSFEFPTPIEEPRKILPAMYIGLVPVTKPTGVDVLNMAIEEMVSSLRLSLSDEHDETELMRPVNVHISPSNIVVECAETGATLVECRVRYLSFMGISLDNVNRCGFIMQVDERQFVAHCFHAEPSAGPLCKTIEAACKLRYQKCLDAHQRLTRQQNGYSQVPGGSGQTNGRGNASSSPVASAIKSTIAGVFSKINSKIRSK